MCGRKRKKLKKLKPFWAKERSLSANLSLTVLFALTADFQGEIYGQGSLVVGEGALVKADIAVKSIYISGDVQGNIEVKEKINIHSTGKFSGDVHTPVFIMEEGALFDGRSHMAECENKKDVLQSE